MSPPLPEQQRAGPVIWEESPRWVRARAAGETVADSKHPPLAWEEGKVVAVSLFPREAVRTGLVPEGGGDGARRYFILGGRERAAWSYPGADGIADHVAFDWSAMD